MIGMGCVRRDQLGRGDRRAGGGGRGSVESCAAGRFARTDRQTATTLPMLPDCRARAAGAVVVVEMLEIGDVEGGRVLTTTTTE